MTAWAVSDTRPFSPTSWWPGIFIGVGLLYGGVVPAVINLGESQLGAGRFLALSVLFHWLPVGGALWYAIATLEPTAYAYLVKWCVATLGAMVLLTAGGCIQRLLRPRKPG